MFFFFFRIFSRFATVAVSDAAQRRGMHGWRFLRLVSQEV